MKVAEVIFPIKNSASIRNQNTMFLNKELLYSRCPGKIVVHPAIRPFMILVDCLIKQCGVFSKAFII